ncbi:hypothetical protein BKA66DRAFT_58533 [Pyrenochaeta sp. MPI-SDFR-AT-0127]|nr:hypothetical protein BKA66DRAFT_58533 [Pyrenochaeta sp. MPI-SDFR-AT-0127]
MGYWRPMETIADERAYHVRSQTHRTIVSRIVFVRCSVVEHQPPSEPLCARFPPLRCAREMLTLYQPVESHRPTRVHHAKPHSCRPTPFVYTANQTALHRPPKRSYRRNTAWLRLDSSSSLHITQARMHSHLGRRPQCDRNLIFAWPVASTMVHAAVNGTNRAVQTSWASCTLPIAELPAVAPTLCQQPCGVQHELRESSSHRTAGWYRR